MSARALLGFPMLEEGPFDETEESEESLAEDALREECELYARFEGGEEEEEGELREVADTRAADRVSAEKKKSARKKLAEELLLGKLFRGQTKTDVEFFLKLLGGNTSMRQLYESLKEHSAWADVRNMSAADGLNGAYVGGGDLGCILDETIAFYNEQDLWDIPPDATKLPWLLYFDGRTVFGKNELFAWGPKLGACPQSPMHIWPLAMVKWEGSESYQKLSVVARLLELEKVVRERQGKPVRVGGRTLDLVFIVVVDWMALSGLMHNTAEPSARPTQAGGDPVCCGLCGLRASQLQMDNPDVENFFARADDVRWRSDIRFIPLGPSFFIWEPLHCHTRCLDLILHVLLSRAKPQLRGKIVELLSSCGRNWPDKPKSAHSFIIKEVCFPLFPSSIFF